jgi:hypothetical protein
LNPASKQPDGVRLFIAANVLLWSLPLQLNLLLTLVAALRLPAPVQRLPRTAWLLCGGLLAYGLLAFVVGPCGDGGIKSAASAVIMGLVFIAIGRLGGAVQQGQPLISPVEASAMLALIVGAAAIEYIYKLMTWVHEDMLRVGGLYLEPSHLALSAVPLIFLLWMRGTLAQRALAIAAAVLLMVVSYSTTFLALLVLLPLIAYLGAVFQRRINPLALVGLLVVATAPLALPLLAGSEDTLLRLNDLIDLREDANISSLVYANGWQLLDSYFSSTSGLGLGLNAMGCSPRAYTDITEWLGLFDLADQNFNDGSFILSKLGSEFGMIGLLLFAAIAVYSMRYLWRSGRPTTSSATCIAAAWLAIIGLGGLIRSGGGYFAGPVLLAVFAAVVLNLRSAPARQAACATDEASA